MNNELQDFLRLPYAELEELNLYAKEQRMKRVPIHQIQEERLKYLTDEKRIKAVTLLFSDLEGRLHMLDYDKKFLLKSWEQPHFRRLLDPRLHGAKGERPAAGSRLVRFLLGSGRHFRRG